MSIVDDDDDDEWITGEGREMDDGGLYDEDEEYKRGEVDDKLEEAYDGSDSDGHGYGQHGARVAAVARDADGRHGYGLGGGARTLARVAGRSSSDGNNSPSPISDVYFVGNDATLQCVVCG